MKIAVMNYQYNNVDDFLSDELFVKWVQNPDEETNAHWQNFLKMYPEKESLILQARKIVVNLKKVDDLATLANENDELKKVWNSIRFTINAQDQKRKTANIYRQLPYIAASLLLILLSVVIINKQLESKQTITAGYQEIKYFWLPDSTYVTLNANSTLAYEEDINKSDSREVWLTGEAFFNVKKKDNKNFIVHTNELKVEVLGTRFNVSTRRGNSSVVLKSGKVKIETPAKGEILMKPGEMVEVAGKEVKQKLVNPDNYLAWTDKIIAFNDESLAKIAIRIKDHYGYDVVIEDANLINRKFTGSAPYNNVDVLLQKLGKIFNVEAEKKENRIIIKNKE